MSIALECESCGRKFRHKQEHAHRRFICPSCGHKLAHFEPGSRGHDVFISYSAADKQAADAVRATLEKKGRRCWIAPRDILPGADWGEAIIDAIEHGCLMVLVFSADANKSHQVKREVERAASKGLPIVPFRIEDVPLSKSMEFFISTQHWFDAFPPPFTRHLQAFADAVEKLLSGPHDRPRAPGAQENRPPRGPSLSNPGSRSMGALGRPLPFIMAGAGVLIGLVIVVLIIALWPNGDPVPPAGSTSSESVQRPSENAMVGTWRLSDASVRSLDSQIERIVEQGRVRETIEDARRKFRDFRLRIEPMSQSDQIRFVMLGRNESPVRATLSSSGNPNRFEGSAGRRTIVVEIDSSGTLKASGIPYSLLNDPMTYQRAD